jgi:hypothetical protein
MEYQFQSNAYLASSFTPGVTEIEFLSPPVDGGQLRMFGKFFYFKDVPTNSGYDILAYTGGSFTFTDLENWVEAIFLNAMEKNYESINRGTWEVISTSPGTPSVTVRFTSKEPSIGSAGAFIPLSSITWPDTEANFINNFGTSKTYVENFSAIIQLYVEKTYLADDFVKVFESSTKNDENGICVFQFNEIIKAYFKILSYQPTFNATSPDYTDHQIKRYFIKYAERIGSSNIVQAVETDYIRLALYAGLDYISYKTVDFFDEYCDVNHDRKFLTPQPRSKNINKTTQEYLWFYNKRTEDVMSISLTIYYTDGTNTNIITSGIVDPEIHVVYYFPTGYSQLDVGSYAPSKTVDRYIVQVVYQSEEESSEVFTYLVSRISRQYNNYFLFRNSLGGMDMLWTHGELTREINVDKDVAQRYIKSDYTLTQGEFIDFNEVINQTFKITVGHRDRIEGYTEAQWLAYLQDLILSTEVYIILNDEFVRINIKPQKSTLYNRKADVNDFDFTFTISGKDKVYSPLII